jgi:hypothetical protein
MNQQVLAENLRSSVSPKHRSSVAKTVGLGVLLPISVVADIITIGPPFAIANLVGLVSSYHDWQTSSMVMNMLNQPSAVTWVPHPALQAFSQRAQMRNGIPANEDFDALASSLGLYPHLAVVGQALRDAEIKRHSEGSQARPSGNGTNYGIQLSNVGVTVPTSLTFSARDVNTLSHFGGTQ